MALKVEVETAPESGSWNDYTSLVQAKSLYVVTQGGADVGTSRAILRDTAGTATILPEAGWRVSDGAVVIFRGKIKRRGKTERNTKTRYKWYDITAQDSTCLLTDDVVDSGGLRSTAETDKARIEWLLTTYGTKGVTGGSTVQVLLGTNMPEQDYTGLNLYEAIGEVLKLSGGSVYVDTSLVLHHYKTESSAAPFNLSDNPNGSTTFGYQGFDFPDDSVELANAVFVIGLDGVGEWVTDATSISTYGRRETTFRDPSLADSTARQAAGNAILTKYKDPRGPIRVRVFKAGLKAGMTIQITNSLWGLSAVTYAIEQVTASIIGRSQLVYDINLQDSPITLQNYLTDHLTTINNDVKRSTDIAVDYASQFLIGQVKVVNSLPSLPDVAYPIGRMVMLTVDNQLYRNPDDVAWVRVVRTPDLAGQVTSTQIADDAISSPQILAGSITGQDILAGTIASDQLAANSIIAGKIAAGAIGADALAAQIVLADKLLTTGLSGRRVEIDDEGIRNYSASEQLLVNIPTIGTDPVSIVGAVEASSLVSTATAELRGQNVLSAGSVTEAQTGVATPTSAPVLASSVPSLGLGTTPAQPGAGICYDPNGGAGGATPSYWIGADPTTGNLLDLAYEYNSSTGALLRTLQKTGTTTTQTGTIGSTSHVADTTQAYSGASESQIGTPLTMPRDGTITKVSAYLAGYGGSAACKNAIWNTSGTALRESAAYTAASKTFSNGNDDKYDKALTSGLFLASGTAFWAGFLHTSSGDGFFYSRDDGSGKTTKRGDGLDGDMTGISTDSATKPNIYVTYTYEVDSSVEGAVAKIVGVARVTGSDVLWVLDATGWLYKYVRSTLTYSAKYDLSAYVAGTKANAGLFYDGTNLVITTASGVTASEQVRFIKVNASTGAYISTHTTTGLAVDGAAATVRGGYLSSGYYHVALGGAVAGVRPYDSTTYAYFANAEFGDPGEVSGGVAVGSSTYGVGWSSTNPAKVWLFTTWLWTTESAVYWVCYTWYDITGTTHETAPSPRASVTMGRRRQLTVSTPVIPGGAAEPPDRVRVYFARNASDPGGANYKLQSTDALTARVLQAYNSGGAANPTSNSFPGGTAAILRSSTTGWDFRGDGFAVHGGTSFPSSPPTGAHYFRTDIGQWFFYDGTRWLTTQLFSTQNVPRGDGASTLGDLATAISASTTGNLIRGPLPVPPGFSDMFVTSYEASFIVASGGTALGASHKWVGTATLQGSSGVLGTIDIASGASNTWRRASSGAINALIGTDTAFMTSWAKTGTPGNLTLGETVFYRLVAT